MESWEEDKGKECKVGFIHIVKLAVHSAYTMSGRKVASTAAVPIESTQTVHILLHMYLLIRSYHSLTNSGVSKTRGPFGAFAST